jgi:hypothetical protein
MSLLHPARLNGLEPYAYLKDILERLPVQPARYIDELPPSSMGAGGMTHWPGVNTATSRSQMTIQTFRFYFRPRSERYERYLSATHWAFAEWFSRRLKPIREQLRGPEAKGVNIVNLMLHEVAEHAWRPNEWAQRLNSFEFSFVCDLSPLRDQPPIQNIAKLMQFASEMTAQAPWPQVRALSSALAQPLSEAERQSLAPYLTWPREFFFRDMSYDGERLEAMMRKAWREARELYKEARYSGASPGAIVVGGDR